MKSKLCLVVAVLALGACQSLPEKQPVTDSPIQLRVGEWRTTDTLLVVTDASLSTYQNESFPDAQALTRAYVASLPTASAKAERQGPYRVGTISFGGTKRQGAPIAPYDVQAILTPDWGKDRTDPALGRAARRAVSPGLWLQHAAPARQAQVLLEERAKVAPPGVR